ncbi:MAG: class I SAM-dependent methyltransferase [Anaerolineaceae bacterium]
MKKNRIPETDHGIQGEVSVTAYDQMQRNLRDKGWIETDAVIRSAITSGYALEIGHGPGYLGLEWLKNTTDTRLTGLDISPDMTALAGQNARGYGLQDRTDYRQGEGNRLPFPDNTFDAVFTNGSLHEWVDPEGTFEEIHRVLKPGGRYYISDLRRDMPVFMRWFLWLGTKPAFIRPYLFSSIDASYTPDELRLMVERTSLKGAAIGGNSIGSEISGRKMA